MSSSEVTDLSFELIERITNSFSEEQKLGSGGYGEVYKGVLNGDEIAVKKLFPMNGLDDKEFTKEFRNLMMVQHQNIVRLIAYCYEVKHKHTEYNGELVFAKVIERVLCFEYVQNGSLAKHITDKSCIHDWPTTYKIIKGTCEGLHYLHKGRKEYIYHLDLKPDNILLDNNMVPKIADFGLSRLFGSSRTYVTSTQRGTVGFMPPEYIDKNVITPKNDVFSLGVIIFQIMAGKQGYNNYCESSSPQEFMDHVQENWKKSLLAKAGYTSEEIDLLLLGVKKCIRIAVTCVETNREKRPTTMQIIDELNKLETHITKMSKCAQKQLTVQRSSDSKDIVVDPSQEIRFPFELKRDISCCLQLTNTADDLIAFNIKLDKNKYCARPNKGTMLPCSKRYITITLRPQEKAPPNMQCHDMFIVQGTRVREDFTPEQITEDFFQKVAMEMAVDEVTLPIVFVAVDTYLCWDLPQDTVGEKISGPVADCTGPSPMERRGLEDRMPARVSTGERKNTGILEWFGPPERNTLRPLWSCIV